MRMARHWTLLAGAAVASISSSGNAVANPSSSQDFHLPAQPLAESLFAIGKATDTEILFLSGDVDGLTAAALNGTYSAEDAVRTVTAPTPLHVEIKDGSIFIRRRSTASATEQPQTEDIVVTGSRIRGGPIASPVVELSQAEIERSGKTNIGDAVRTLPQNFSGGQNPGVAGGGDQGGTNSNFGSASTINLRGLGADATLTLINGHRVAYDSYVQGVDVDTIPLAALDRIEVVPDGASALYGSDAVGGVANIILKKDYDGLSTSARYGGATDGGDHQTELSAVTGTKWSQGGVIATFDFTHVSPITAADRSYTQSLSPDQTLVPGKSQYSGVISGHQALGAVTFSIDGLFNRRTSSVVTAYLPPADYLVSGSRNPFTETSWSISPRASVAIGPSWSSYLTGTYGRDDSGVATRYYTSGVETLNGNVHYDNSVRTVEAGVEGPLLSFLSQSIRLAAGAGYRSNALDVRSASTTAAYAEMFGRRNSYYVYGELAVPLISPAMGIPAVYRLATTGAVRYERYPGQASLATPKLGVIYSPVRTLEFKASWGKSFKTPTLYEQLQAVSVTVLPASYLASGLPSSANALLVSGGSQDLKPEKATSWTFTADVKPDLLPGLDIQLSYFHTNYNDRVVQPIASLGNIYANPIYSDLVTLNPSAAFQQQIINLASVGLRNLTGATYDAATVAALVDDRNRNAARQIIHGLDAALSYRMTFGADQTVTASASGSYLKSRQQLGPDQPFTTLSGRLFNAPHWRASGSLGWESDVASLAANVTYIGAVTDDRFIVPIRIHAIAPIDLTAHYQIPSGHGLTDGIGFTITVQNILNQKPATIETTTPYDPTYDSTNYPAVGRFVSFTITKTL